MNQCYKWNIWFETDHSIIFKYRQIALVHYGYGYDWVNKISENDTYVCSLLFQLLYY